MDRWVGFLPKGKPQRYARESGNPANPHQTRQNTWMPACAGMTDQKNLACRKPVKIAGNKKNLFFKETDQSSQT